MPYETLIDDQEENLDYTLLLEEAGKIWHETSSDLDKRYAADAFFCTAALVLPDCTKKEDYTKWFEEAYQYLNSEWPEAKIMENIYLEGPTRIMNLYRSAVHNFNEVGHGPHSLVELLRAIIYRDRRVIKYSYRNEHPALVRQSDSCDGVRFSSSALTK